VDYFQGRGNYQDRWLVETPEFKADASTFVGNIIGGRLDYKAFAEATRRLLPQLLIEPKPNLRHRIEAPVIVSRTLWNLSSQASIRIRQTSLGLQHFRASNMRNSISTPTTVASAAP
jgi:hypothetical protein